MRHRMAADLETLSVKIAHLAGIEVTRCSQKSCGEIESCVEAELAKDGRGGDKVSLAAIVKGDTNTLPSRITQSLSNVQAVPARCFYPLHLSAENFKRQNVTHITRFGLAELAPSQLQFVVHQENNASCSHD